MLWHAGPEQWLLYSIGGDGRILEHDPTANELDSVDLTLVIGGEAGAKVCLRTGGPYDNNTTGWHSIVDVRCLESSRGRSKIPRASCCRINFLYTLFILQKNTSRGIFTE